MSSNSGSTAAYFRPLRLLAGAAMLAVLLVPTYFLLIREPDDPLLQRARLLETQTDGTSLRVGLDLGELAPDFEMSTHAGRRLRLSELRGAPLIVNFWATWCTSCLSEMPDIQALQSELGPDKLVVLAINAGEARARAQEFIDFLDAPFVYGLDPDLVITDAYGVYGLPLSVFLDSGGIVRGVYRGHATPQILRTLVTAALNAQPPGDIPVVLRPVSTIPRDRTLTVSSSGEGAVTFSSRSLRCDTVYCADSALAPLSAFAGIIEYQLGEDAHGEPALTVRYQRSSISEPQVIEAVRLLLEDTEDEAYGDRPVQVIYANER